MEWFTLELVSLVQGSSSNSSSSSPDKPSAAEHEGKLWHSRALCLNAVALETIAPWQKLQPQWTWSCSHSSQLQRKISHFSSHNSAILCHTWKQGTGYQYIKTSFVYSEHAHLIWRYYFEEKRLVLQATMLEQKHVQILKVTGFGLLANANT